jgi:hypothetical protein
LLFIYFAAKLGIYPENQPFLHRKNEKNATFLKKRLHPNYPHESSFPQKGHLQKQKRKDIPADIPSPSESTKPINQ